MTPFRLIAVSAALAAGTAAAQAQTAVTRQITTEPVETIVTQEPDGSTVVTRRPLADRPADMLPAPSVRYAPIAAPLAQETYVEPAVREPTTVGVRTTTSTRRTVTRRVTTAPRVRSTRTVTRTTLARRAPLVLTPSERRVVYQTIVRREVYPSAGVAVEPAPVYDTYATTYGGPVYRSYDTYDSYGTTYAAPVYRSYDYDTYAAPVVRSYDYDRTYAAPVVSPPVVAETEIVEPPAPIPYPATTGYAPRRYATTYVVGSRLPASVPLVAVPETVAARVPAVRDYSYVVVGGRVYLVDPATRIVVADITGQY